MLSLKIIPKNQSLLNSFNMTTEITYFVKPKNNGLLFCLHKYVPECAWDDFTFSS